MAKPHLKYCLQLQTNEGVRAGEQGWGGDQAKHREGLGVNPLPSPLKRVSGD